MARNLFKVVLALVASAVIIAALGFILAREETKSDYLPLIIISFTSGVLVSAIITAIVEAILKLQSKRDELRSRKLQATISLYTNFQSTEMIDVRSRLDRMLRRGGISEHTLESLYKEYFIESGDRELEKDWISMSSIIHFYECVADLIKHDHIDLEFAGYNFKKYFKYLDGNKSFKRILENTSNSNEVWYFISRWQYLRESKCFD